MKQTLTKKEIDNRFAYHPPRGDQAEKYVKIREAGKRMAKLINKNCLDTREKSLAITKIEEAIMWANTSIARHEE